MKLPRPEPKGFWERAADGVSWWALVLFGLGCILIGATGVAISMSKGTVVAWLAFYGIPFVIFLFWYRIAWEKWERRNDG